MIISVDVETSKDGKTLDLEAHPDSFKLGCVYDGTEANFFIYPEKMWDYIVTLGRHLHKSRKMLYVYAHHHIYDILTYAPRGNPNLVYLCESPLIASYREDGHDIVRFYDSKGIFPSSLQKLGSLLDVPKLDKPRSVDIFSLQPYCQRDCEIVYLAITRLKKDLKEKGVDIRYFVTINQIAINMMLKEMKSRIAPYFWYHREKSMPKYIKHKQFVHMGYRGGRIQAFQVGTFPNCKQIDCNSLYGEAATKIQFPDLRTQRTINNPLITLSPTELLSKPGISRALLYNKDNYLGFLPVRTPGFSYVPGQGTYIVGTWCHNELLYAINNGYELLAIEKSTFWEEAIENPYLDIIPKWYSERLRSPFWSSFYKNIITRHIGKFGQKLKEREMIIDDVNLVYDYIDKGFMPKKGYDTDYLYEKSLTSNHKKYYLPIIPALITAQSRIIMSEHYKKISPAHLLYTATDSILVTENTNLSKFSFGSELGSFKHEAQGDVMIWGRNTYSIGSKVKAGGIALSDDQAPMFQYGRFTSKAMRTYNNCSDLKKIGTFYTKNHDLYDTIKSHVKNMSMLEKARYLQDFYLNDVSWFQDSLLNANLALPKTLVKANN